MKWLWCSALAFICASMSASSGTDRVFCCCGSWSCCRLGNGKFRSGGDDIDSRLMCAHLLSSFVSTELDGAVRNLQLDSGEPELFGALQHGNRHPRSLLAVPPPGPQGARTGPADVCTKPGYVRDPADCSVFYYCLEYNGAFLPLKQNCNPDLYYDIETNMCNYKEFVECQIHNRAS